jgi:uncharacterized oligopeptide transporter (OPT) family protein
MSEKTMESTDPSARDDSYESKLPFKPYVPAVKQVPEFTLFALVLGIILGMIFNAANAYLGLKIGLTVSASIPSAVISMGVLRLLLPRLIGRDGTILENNIVHAFASTGESLAAAVIFTVPAIIFLGGQFSNATVFWLGLIGGLLGILMMIPLRHALMIKEHKTLPFPEGTACAKVLIAGDKGGATAKPVFLGIVTSALFKFAMSGVRLFKDVLEWSFPGLHMAGFGYEVSPLFIGVGYLVGLEIAGTMLAGGLLGYWVLIPLIHAIGGANIIAPGGVPISTMSTAELRSTYVRYIGAGGVAFGGLLSLLRSLPDIADSLKHSIKALTDVRKQEEKGGAAAAKVGKLDREHKDIVWSGAILGFLVGMFGVEFPWHMGPESLSDNARLVLGILAHAGIGGLGGGVLCALLMNLISRAASRLSGRFPRDREDLSLTVIGGGVAAMMALMYFLPMFGLNFGEVLIVVLFSFFFTAVSSRMVGLIGTTNQPVSGMTITALLAITLLFMWLGHSMATVKVAAIMGGAIVCVAISLSGDLSQDLKTAALIGATPWKCQLAQILATAASAVRSGFILLLLYAAYGLGAPTAAHPHPLEAPQAQLMAKLVEGVTGGTLPWTLLLLGAGIGVVVELCGVSALAFSIGLYLPISNWPMIMVGGLVNWWTHGGKGEVEGEDAGSLFSSGLIAGDALTGIALAVLTVIGLDAGNGLRKFLPLREPDAGSMGVEAVISTVLYAGLVWMLYSYAKTKKRAHA